MVLGVSLLALAALTRVGSGLVLSPETFSQYVDLIDSISVLVGGVGTGLSGFSFSAANRQARAVFDPRAKVKPYNSASAAEALHRKAA